MFFLPKGEGRVMLEVSQGFWAGTHLGPWEGAGMGPMVGHVVGWVP